MGRGASVKHVAAVTVTETRSTSSGDAWPRASTLSRVKADAAIDSRGQQFSKWSESRSFEETALFRSFPSRTFPRCLPFVLIVITPSAAPLKHLSSPLWGSGPRPPMEAQHFTETFKFDTGTVLIQFPTLQSLLAWNCGPNVKE